MSFPFYKQLNAMDCGATCLRMIARYYGKHYNADTLRQKTGFNKDGVSLLGISDAAEAIGFRSFGIQITFQQLKKVDVPCILHWEQNHFVVLVSIKRKLKVADPARGMINYSENEFQQFWSVGFDAEGNKVGLALLLEPTPLFYEEPGEKEKKFNRWNLVKTYLSRSRWQVMQVFTALFLTSVFQFVFPFLAQTVVDTGITTKNLQYVVVVLIAQVVLMLSRATVDFIRSRILLRISNIFNISILSDFWIKLTRLPISYFTLHHTGDIMQRLGDQRQIQTFFTGPVLNTLFSVLNFFVYAIILVTYSISLFFIFLIGSVAYFAWVQFFLSIRRKINYQTFHLSAKENNLTLQLIHGMPELKLNNAEKLKRWNWESLQAKIFRLNFKAMNYNQWQQAGALIINQSKDIAISFLVAKMVIDGELTLGTMFAVQYIVGQLNSPVEQWISFVQSAQDAKISVERLNEIHQLDDEEKTNATYIPFLPRNKTLQISHLSFTYPGNEGFPVLKDISMLIPEGKVTAIVGGSGSGKTTLLKLLLKFYDQYAGEIKVDEVNFKYMQPSFWREQCGCVMQDGYIFNDTIAGNITLNKDMFDYERLARCCKTANILSFIESLPNGFHTQLGDDGVSMSQGQKQRLLIARAIYKDPKYLFFDEATNALDANNEKVIIENLRDFFRGRTVVVVAHRLSTVRDADQIVVINDGRITESGTHDALSQKRGKYYELVKNQLELGN